MVPITRAALSVRITLLAGAATLFLAGCGPTVVVLKNPANGEVAQCKGDALANWNPYAATEACAKGYEAAGWQRMSTY